MWTGTPGLCQEVSLEVWIQVGLCVGAQCLRMLPVETSHVCGSRASGAGGQIIILSIYIAGLVACSLGPSQMGLSVTQFTDGTTTAQKELPEITP